MADYNIYIHSLGGEAQQSQNSPWKKTDDSQNKPWDIHRYENQPDEDAVPSFLTSAANSKIAKFGGGVGVAIAVAAAVVKMSISLGAKVESFIGEETGIFHHEFRDYQNELNAVFHPISTTISTIHQHRADVRQNVRNTMQRELLGDSEINHYTNRGV